MTIERNFANRILKIETDSFASQAHGSAMVSYGNTVVLGTVTMSEEDVEADFLPLTVDYEERYYAAGKISGSRFIRREGRPSEEAILVSRMIDRAIRPYFPKNLRKEVQVILTVFAFDEENDPDFPAFLATSLALSLSPIPWKGPVAGVRVGIKENGEFVINPTYEEREKSKMDIFVGGVEEKNGEIVVNMLDGKGNEFSEKELISGIEYAKRYIKELISLQKEIKEKEKRGKIELPLELPNLEKILKENYSEIKKIFLLMKEERGKEKYYEARKELQEKLGLDSLAYEILLEKVLHKMILEEGIRPDGRKEKDIRQITCKAGVFPRTHGSGLFFRGLTHVVSIVTLGAPGDELLLEGMEVSGRKKFIHHYNFPPYSAGEVKKLGPPGRREIGHGALVEKALLSLVPSPEEFPYTIRVVSEVLSSNGSTSMASVCASSLALFDAGVKMRKSAAGISCGLILEKEISEDDTGESFSPKERKFKILTDIQGPEDSLGDMDFKIAGTSEGITAIQLDVKTRGLTKEMIEKTAAQAKEAREIILDKMKEAIPAPRPQLSPYAPRVLSIKINPDKIREVIGPGGKTINEIIEETDVRIDIEEDGLIFVTAKDKESGERAIKFIKNIAREIKPGEIFSGKIKRIAEFGLIVEILPNQTGLLHISEIFPRRRLKPAVAKKILNRRYKLNQIIQVKVKEINEDGRITLTLVHRR